VTERATPAGLDWRWSGGPGPAKATLHDMADDVLSLADGQLADR